MLINSKNKPTNKISPVLFILLALCFFSSLSCTKSQDDEKLEELNKKVLALEEENKKLKGSQQNKDGEDSQEDQEDNSNDNGQNDGNDADNDNQGSSNSHQNDRFEPNNSIGTSSNLVIDQKVSFNLCGDQDVDFFTFEIQQDLILEFSLILPDNQYVGKEINLSILSEEEIVLLSYRKFNEAIKLPALKKGKYHIKIESKDNITEDPGDITLELKAINQEVIVLDNTKPMRLLLDENIDGFFNLQPESKTVFLRIEQSLDNCHAFKFNFWGQNNLNEFSLENMNGEEVMEGVSVITSNLAADPQIIFTNNLPKGIYFLKVKRNIIVNSNPSAFTMNYQVVSISDNCDDSIETPNALTLGQTIEDFSFPLKDKDYYKFFMESGGNIDILLDVPALIDNTSFVYKLYFENFEERKMIWESTDILKLTKQKQTIGYIRSGVYYITIEQRTLTNQFIGAKDLSFFKPYKLTINFNQVDFYEPNNTLESASFIGIDQVVEAELFNVFNNTRTADMYTFEITEADKYETVLKFKDNKNTTLYVDFLDKDQQVLNLETTGIFNAVGSGKTTIIPLSDLQIGTYYFIISNVPDYRTTSKQNDILPYELTIRKKR